MSEIVNSVVVPSTPVVRPKSRLRRILRIAGKILVGVLVTLLLVAVVAQLVFTFSGSGQWESLGARRGVEIFVKKIPGENIKQYKAVFQVKSTMTRFAAFSTIENSDLQIGYYDMKDIQKVSDQLIYSTWKQKFPSPFKPRHFVVKNEFTQDPKTKVLVFTVSAANDKLPNDECCVRVPKMNNSWTLTPIGKGELRVEWVSDLDMGGYMPYMALNSYQPGGMRFFARNMQGYLDQKLYDNVKYAWIQEP